MYILEFTDQAVKDLIRLKMSEPIAYKKVQNLLLELIDHPKTGTGKPQLKRYNLSWLYSRLVTDKHRLIYEILEEKIIVLVLSASGHYEDK
jgi:toxin YoeB